MLYYFATCISLLTVLFSHWLDVDDEYEDEDTWEDGAEDILEKGK